MYKSYIEESSNRNKKEVASEMAPVSGDLATQIDDLISKHRVVVFSKSTCPFCARTKALLDSLNKEYYELALDKLENTAGWQDALQEKTGQRTVPNVFIAGQHIGGNDRVQELFKNGELTGLLRTHNYEYDLIVIGGGSGGLAAAKEAAKLGAKVACFDFVEPTPVGTTWGLGGTCVNVGCIPKKLMHQAACLRESMADADPYGWEGVESDKLAMNWEKLRGAVQDHIGSLNWGYRVQLRSNKVDYHNRYAKLVNANTVIGRDRSGKEQEFTTEKIIFAVGERPNYPNIPGAKEFGITSDDLFSLDRVPGDTVVIGASYVALECAGFLAAMGYSVTVVVRSILLRGFDQELSEMIGKYMAEHNVKFIRPAVPTKIEKDAASGKLTVTVQVSDGDKKVEQQLQCDTAMFAIGRAPILDPLNLPSANIQLSKAGRFVVNEADRTSCESIYAIGDAAEGRPQLTPAAIQAGRLLARRLYGGSSILCDYAGVPTTVFTPIEYSCCGLSEEEALQRFGKERLIIFHKFFTPLEWTVPHRPDNTCFIKVICDNQQNNTIIGLHYLGPNAGEVMQGFAVAMKTGATKDDLDNSIGIHPTNAEWITQMDVVKGSGEEPTTTGC